ncbi:MAG: hypothetical protein ACKV2Q_25975 [Planctomycetaceae bacterium]
MTFHLWDWIRNNANGAPIEPRRQFLSGLIVWVLAWLVVWWSQDAVAVATAKATSTATSSRTAPQISATPAVTPTDSAEKAKQVAPVTSGSSEAVLSWTGTFIGLGLFWGGGLLIYRPLTGWGLFLSWLRRFETIERLALVSALSLTSSAVVLHWFWSHIHAWMVAAVAAFLVLSAAFGWKLPGKKES